MCLYRPRTKIKIQASVKWNSFDENIAVLKIKISLQVFLAEFQIWIIIVMIIIIIGHTAKSVTELLNFPWHHVWLSITTNSYRFLLWRHIFYKDKDVVTKAFSTMITMVESEGSFGFDFGCFGCFSGWQFHQLVTLQQVIITWEIFEEFLFPSVLFLLSRWTEGFDFTDHLSLSLTESLRILWDF